jgi:hypothetical protein
MIPTGWKLVPIDPTPAMMAASKRAISSYIETLPQEDRDRVKGRRRGWRVKLDKKLKLRWAAMLAAAPECNELPSTEQ